MGRNNNKAGVDDEVTKKEYKQNKTTTTNYDQIRKKKQ